MIMLMSVLNAVAQYDVLKIVHGNTTDFAALTVIDSIYFDMDSGVMYVQPTNGNVAVPIRYADVSEMCVIDSASCPKRLKIAYNGNTVSVDNPYFLGGVSVTADGAYVTVNNTNDSNEYEAELSGKTTDGSFLYNGVYKTTLILNGVSINSKRGAAIDIQCGKRVALELKKGTESTLVDCAGGEQKAALYCKGHLEIDKAGTLSVTGKTGHAISAKEYIKLKKSDGTINILGAVKDGIHCKQYFVGNGFTVNIKGVGDDGIQTELDGAENEDGIADGTLIINGGTYDIVNTTNGSTDGTDTDTAKGLNADGNMQLNGGTITIAMSGTGGKGIRVEGTYTQGTEDGEGPTLTVSTTGSAYSSGSSTGGNTGGNWRPGGGGGGGRPGGGTSGSDAKAIKVLGAVIVNGGTTVVTTEKSGAEGLESKTGITIKGGSHYFKCYDDCINTSGIIDFAGGNTVCFANGNDAVDSNYGRKGAITISGGNVFAYTTKGSPEEGLDCDNNSYIVITGGIAVSAGGSQGGGGGWGGSSSSQSVGSSTQGYYLGSSPSSYNATNYYTLYSTTDEPICTFKFDASVSNTLSLLTAPNLGKGSIKVKSGTAAPTSAQSQVLNNAGKAVFFIAPTVTATTTSATVTAK